MDHAVGAGGFCEPTEITIDGIAASDYFEQAQDALIAGYRKHRQLTDEQLKLLPLFFLARAFTYVGWSHTRHETETAKELTPMLLAAACGLAEEYLSK